MKLMSLFDGSGGFPLAASLCGIKPIYAAEVEPYPIAVTKNRFPKMKHLGDVSKVKGGEIEPVDIITFGSPCQDMSTAGKRAGLKHTAVGDEETTRSGLFMEAIRIIKEMRESTNGIYPRFAIWENVPGAFSSNKGEDFRTVLEEFIKTVEKGAFMPEVPKGGWPYSDSYIGDGWSIAYRVFDAQHWGVSQRRRRIYLVADFRGECARKILFEREGVRGYFTQSRTPWQGIASDAQKCVGTDDRAGESKLVLDDQGGQRICVRTDGKSPTLRAEAHGNVPCIINKKTLVYDTRGNGDGETVPTITGDHNNRVTDYTCLVVEPAVRCYDIGEARLRTPSEYIEKTPSGINSTIVAKGPSALAYKNEIRYIVRRLTPTECARLQGFPDLWGHLNKKENFTDEEYKFWLEVRNAYAKINNKAVKDYTKAQILTWYNKLHSDSAEYKMWGNGIALPNALYVMQGIAVVERVTND